jgi:hypothetical protein
MNELSDTCKSVAIHWGLTFKCVRDDLAVAGSPERCLSRMVIEDDGQRLFILEEISPQNREMIALEIEYMTILMQEEGCLKDTWRT